MLTTAFPNLFESESVEDRKLRFHVLYEMLKDLTDEQLRKSVIKFCLKTKDAFKSINIIREIRKYALLDSDFLTATEALTYFSKNRSTVMDKVRNGVKLSPFEEICLKAYDTIGYYNFQKSTNPSATNSEFYRIYNLLVETHIQNKIESNFTETMKMKENNESLS